MTWVFQIIYDINFFFMEDLKRHFGLDYNRLSRMSIVEEGAVKVCNSQISNSSLIWC